MHRSCARLQGMIAPSTGLLCSWLGAGEQGVGKAGVRHSSCGVSGSGDSSSGDSSIPHCSAAELWLSSEAQALCEPISCPEI